MSAQSWFIFELGFFTQAPDAYICTYTGGIIPPEDICTKENICNGDPRIASWEADPDSDRTLYNWQQKLDLTCVDDWKVTMIGTSLFIGWCTTLLWLPGFADRYGRKRFFWVGMLIQLCLYTCLLLTHSLIVMIILFLCFGALSTVRIQVGYVYLMELMPRKMQAHVTSTWSVQEALIYVICTVYFWQISKHWIYYCLCGYVWNVMSVVFLFWVPESPRYLASAGKMKEARQVFE